MGAVSWAPGGCLWHSWHTTTRPRHEAGPRSSDVGPTPAACVRRATFPDLELGLDALDVLFGGQRDHADPMQVAADDAEAAISSIWARAPRGTSLTRFQLNSGRGALMRCVGRVGRPALAAS